MEPDISLADEHAAKPAARMRGRFSRVLILIVLLCVGILYISRSPDNFPEGGGVYTVEPGASLKSIGTELSEQGYVRSRMVFSTLVTFFGGERSISPGDYAFHTGEGTLGIARQIATGAHHLDPIKVTIPEGDTARDIADKLAKKIPDFDTAAFLTITKGDEGYLFPETYFFYPKTKPEEIRKDMLAMFDKQTVDILTASALGSRSKKDVVVMASLVEREAHGDEDRTTIAGILWKRLSIGMALQVDATVAYAAGVEDTELTKKDFSVDSPYNTYKYKGLPPGPIASPGLEAIEATIHPAKTDYLYYLHDTRGTIHYAKTYAEHQKNIAKYLK